MKKNKNIPISYSFYYEQELKIKEANLAQWLKENRLPILPRQRRKKTTA